MSVAAGGDGDDGQRAGGGLGCPGADAEVLTQEHRPVETDDRPGRDVHGLHNELQDEAQHQHQGETVDGVHEHGGEQL